jgi:hypothetical protein
MPTQEERIFALEQTVAVLNRGIWDISHNETILLGLAIKHDENIREVKSSLATLSERLNTFEHSVNGRFETLEQSMNSRFEGQDKKFDQILLLLNTLIPKPE